MDHGEAGSGLRDTAAVDRQAHRQHSSAMLDLAICADGGDIASSARKRRKSGGEDGPATIVRQACVEHQLGLALNLLALLALTHLLFPRLRCTTSAFFTLSYPLASDGGHGAVYGQGTRDMYLVCGFIVLFTATRAFFLEYVLNPLAEAAGVGKKKARIRFAEQGYLLLYYVVYWSWGVVSLTRPDERGGAGTTLTVEQYLFVQDTPSDVEDVDTLLISLWRDFPRLALAPQMKVYYLSQFAFWLQQIIVIHLEERRKDHYQMLSHHLITSMLLLGSYGYRQIRAGNAILVLMDIVDLIFPLAKILRYLGQQMACDIAFAMFVLLWVAARHVGYLVVCWSIYAHVNSAVMHYGTYSTDTSQMLTSDGGNIILANLLQPLANPDAPTVSFNAEIRWLFLGLLLALQLITVLWFCMIMRVVLRVLRGEGADDSRSDVSDADGDSALRAASTPTEPEHFIQVPASSADYRYVTRQPSARRKGGRGISSGLNLGEHKAILNRIGCLSEEQLAREREMKRRSVSPRPAPGGG